MKESFYVLEDAAFFIFIAAMDMMTAETSAMREGK